MARPPLIASRILPLVPGGIRQLRPPTNFDERPLERPILPGWSANELSRCVGMRRSAFSLGKGRVFSLFDLKSLFHEITAHKTQFRSQNFYTPTGLYEWLIMPEGSSASPGWFVKVINGVSNGLEQVAAYLDDVVVYDSHPSAHFKTIRALSE